jgi:glycosyltransferase involved in cell wall biosynthesis
MFSTDPTALHAGASLQERLRAYGTLVDSLTVIVAGRGHPVHLKLSDRVTVLYPGGRMKIINFVRMLYAARLTSGEMVTAQDPLWTGLLALWSKKGRVQVQVHTDHFSFFQRVLAQYVLRRATCVRVVSHRIREKIAPWTRAPISVLPIYVAREEFASAHQKPKEYGGHKRILVVSRLAPEKQVHLVIEALSQVPEAHLYIVGDGPLRARLVAFAARLGLGERVHFLGWQNAVVAYYQHADCFVLSSAFEGYGMALFEAALAGCPIVSTNVGIAAELPKKSVTIVAPSGYQLASAITESLTPERKTDSQSAREEVSAHLKTYPEYLEAYQRLLTTCGA